MDFSLNDDHVALQDAVQALLRRRVSGSTARQPRDADELASRRWAGMAELGLLGLPFDAEFGGSGQGAVEVMLVAQELGRSLGGGAWLSLRRAGRPTAGRRLARRRSASGWLPAHRRTAVQDAWRSPSQSPTAATDWPAQCDPRRADPRRPAPRWPQDAGAGTATRADGFMVVGPHPDGRGDATASTVFCCESTRPASAGVADGFGTLDGRRAAQCRFDGVVVGAERSDRHGRRGPAAAGGSRSTAPRPPCAPRPPARSRP